MSAHKVGRLSVDQYQDGYPFRVRLSQMHRNGSNEIVGSIDLYGDELEDAIYILQRAVARRDRRAGR